MSAGRSIGTDEYIREGVRVLHVTDTHLGIDRWFRGASTGWRRGDDHLAAFRAALGPALRGEVDLVVHSGDLFDRSRPPAKAVEHARLLLAEAGRVVPVLLSPGNHDRRGLAHHFREGIPGVTIVDRPARVDIAGLAVAVVPWVETAEAWAAAARAFSGCDALVAHQSFDGARVPLYTFRAGKHAETVGAAHMPRVDTVLCGHIHPRQAIRVGETLVVYPGSSERTSFAERSEQKGYAMWEFGARAAWRFVDLPSRPMLVVADEAGLGAITPGALVHVQDAALDAEALARGGWLTPRAEESRQLRLFG